MQGLLLDLGMVRANMCVSGCVLLVYHDLAFDRAHDRSSQ